MKIFIASDHAGFSTKKNVIDFLKNKYSVIDLGPTNEDRTDYPDYADKVAQEMKKDLENSKGILICGSGQGMAMRANKYPFIRAALCWNEESARLSRQHNDANVLVMPGRFIDHEMAEKILDEFFNSGFEGGRHQKRIEKIPVK